MKTYARAANKKVLQAFHKDLLLWFQRHRRDLPWRHRRTLYRIWVAEIMLQQTRTSQVEAYYRRFLRRFPSIKSLAEASLEEVLKCWEGLGYYSRARNLHAAAGMIRTFHHGRFPRSVADVRALPGVGPYTAAAIASMGWGECVAAVDGNVKRVLSRVFTLGRNISSTRYHELANILLYRGDPGAFNEAIMELGALCCLPRNPRCEICPLGLVCMAQTEGNPERYPIRGQARKIPHKEVGAAITVNRNNEVLLARRREEDMLGGLWEFPGGKQEAGESMEECIRRELKEELGIDSIVGPCFMIVPHAFSHFTMNLHAHWVRILRGCPRPLGCSAWEWAPLDHLADYPMGRADVAIRERLVVEKPPFWDG